MQDFDKTRVALHKMLLLVRQTELTLAERYKEQEMRTPTHFGMGQEGPAVGVCHALGKEDVAYSHHRSHNHYLAKGGSVHGLAAELFGRETGCSRGRGGSVHLTAPDQGFIASSAILGETVAVAVGSAFSFKMDGADRIATSFFGDAVAEEGIFYECLNYAALHRLPVLLVSENNLYATESPLSVRQPDGTDVCERVRSFNIAAEKVDGNDVTAVYRAAVKAVAAIRAGGGPYFLECSTYRWLEHVGPHFDYELQRTYRSKEELDLWMERCPVKRSGEGLIADGIASAADLTAWSDETQQQIDADIARAYADPWPEPAGLFDNV